jgi:hypothetical protein
MREGTEGKGSVLRIYSLSDKQCMGVSKNNGRTFYM